jgi:predicted nucleic-acid-binding Zn-ribbon protein
MKRRIPLRLANHPCPKCGSAMYVRKSCCSWRRKGFATIAKCLGACGYREGYERASSKAIVRGRVIMNKRLRRV